MFKSRNVLFTNVYGLLPLVSFWIFLNKNFLESRNAINKRFIKKNIPLIIRLFKEKSRSKEVLSSYASNSQFVFPRVVQGWDGGLDGWRVIFHSEVLSTARVLPPLPPSMMSVLHEHFYHFRVVRGLEKNIFQNLNLMFLIFLCNSAYVENKCKYTTHFPVWHPSHVQFSNTLLQKSFFQDHWVPQSCMKKASWIKNNFFLQQ